MNSQRGFSFIEALMALLIISIGLLGMAGLQAASVYRTHVSQIKSLAAVEAQSVVAAMLANPQALPPETATSAYDLELTDDFPAMVTDCATAVCSPADMATYDLAQWGEQLQADLPAGDGSIACELAPSLRCRVTITWEEKQTNASAGTAAGSMETRSYSIWVRP